MTMEYEELLREIKKSKPKEEKVYNVLELLLKANTVTIETLQASNRLLKHYIMESSIYKENYNYFTPTELFAQCTKEERYDCLKNHQKNMSATIELANKVRHAFGNPLQVNSFYRNKEHNERVGGSKTSQHLSGSAIDLQTYLHDTKFGAAKLYQVCKKLAEEGIKFGQVILYDHFVHISIPYTNSKGKYIENQFLSKRG